MEKVSKIVYNLLLNVLKFILDGGEIIILVIGMFDCKKIEINVEDMGLGIVLEYYECIFDWFYQVDDFFICFVGGIGIGFVFCNELV